MMKPDATARKRLQPTETNLKHSVAAHEAGHAVLTVLVGGKIADLHLRQIDGLRDWWGQVTPLEPSSVSSEDLVKIYFAGPLAESRFWFAFQQAGPAASAIGAQLMTTHFDEEDLLPSFIADIQRDIADESETRDLNWTAINFRVGSAAPIVFMQETSTFESDLIRADCIAKKSDLDIQNLLLASRNLLNADRVRSCVDRLTSEILCLPEQETTVRSLLEHPYRKHLVENHAGRPDRRVKVIEANGHDLTEFIQGLLK